MAWVDDLPRIKAENEAWRAEHLPALRERDRVQAEERERFAAIVRRGLDAINATDNERALVFKRTGVTK